MVEPMRRAAWPFLLSLLAGCAPPRGPEATLKAYLEAVRAGRLDDAYALMSTEYRRAHDRAAFERALESGGRAALATRLRGAKVHLRAEIELEGGDTLPLVEERGGFRLDRDPLDFYPQRNPEEALRSFVRAVEHRRYDIVLRFVPARYQGSVTAEKLRERWTGEKRQELEAQLDTVRAHLGEALEIDPSGDAARLPVGERKQVRLVREDGAWKVEALE